MIDINKLKNKSYYLEEINKNSSLLSKINNEYENRLNEFSNVFKFTNKEIYSFQNAEECFQIKLNISNSNIYDISLSFYKDKDKLCFSPNIQSNPQTEKELYIYEEGIKLFFRNLNSLKTNRIQYLKLFEEIQKIKLNIRNVEEKLRNLNCYLHYSENKKFISNFQKIFTTKKYKSFKEYYEEYFNELPILHKLVWFSPNNNIKGTLSFVTSNYVINKNSVTFNNVQIECHLNKDNESFILYLEDSKDEITEEDFLYLVNKSLFLNKKRLFNLEELPNTLCFDTKITFMDKNKINSCQLAYNDFRQLFNEELIKNHLDNF